jgi:hypothetical protein
VRVRRREELLCLGINKVPVIFSAKGPLPARSSERTRKGQSVIGRMRRENRRRKEGKEGEREREREWLSIIARDFGSASLFFSLFYPAPNRDYSFPFRSFCYSFPFYNDNAFRAPS